MTTPDVRDLEGPCTQTVLELRERVKELTALHRTARLLQDDGAPPEELLQRVVELLPAAWQHPEVACGRIAFGGAEWRTPGSAPPRWTQSAGFRTSSGSLGSIEVGYTEERPPEAEGPFLAEERRLLDSLAEMLRSFLDRREAQRALSEAHHELELRVRERTAELEALNRSLREEVAERERNEARIGLFQESLRRLAAERAATEAAERRSLASDLHDNVGQKLALLKIKLVEIQRNAAFLGLEHTLAEMRSLLDQTIRYTRSLTAEISPQILYDLGLGAAAQWLAEGFRRKHGLEVEVEVDGDDAGLDETARVVLFRALRELLVNTLKHARARRAWVRLSCRGGRVRLSCRDDGAGFDAAALEASWPRTEGFGLFHVKERAEYLGGRVEVESAPGRGALLVVELPARSCDSKEMRDARPGPPG